MQVELITYFLIIFSPQIVLYGIGVVLTGILQAHERFLAPALAPTLSTIVVIITYLLFGYLNRAVAMYESGYVGREDLDHAMRAGAGLPMGPLTLLDLIGNEETRVIIDGHYLKWEEFTSAALKGRFRLLLLAAGFSAFATLPFVGVAAHFFPTKKTVNDAGMVEDDAAEIDG